MASILNVNQLSAKNQDISISSGIDYLDLQQTNSYFLLPSGTSAERSPSATEGAIRWNEDADQFEVYDGEKWRYGRRVYDYMKLEGSPPLNLISMDPNSYRENFTKWFSTGGSPSKAIFSTAPQYNSANGGYIEFNGTSDYATVELSSSITPTDSISQECWFKTASTSQQVLISLQYGISSNNSFALYLENNSWNGLINQAGTSLIISEPFSNTPLTTNQWYHFVHVYSASTETYQARAISQSASNILEIDELSPFNFIAGMNISGGSVIPADTTVTDIDYNNRRITISNPASVSSLNFLITVSIPSSQILYLNGQKIAQELLISPENINYTAENNLITIGADFNGAGVNIGPTSFLNGSISVLRLHTSYMSPSQIRNNYINLKDRYGL